MRYTVLNAIAQEKLADEEFLLTTVGQYFAKLPWNRNGGTIRATLYGKHPANLSILVLKDPHTNLWWCTVTVMERTLATHKDANPITATQKALDNSHALLTDLARILSNAQM